MLRIVGGSLGGRRLAAPPGTGTRPTSEKVREGIFNSLNSMMELSGIHVLDLFAGSGAMGIEALSRGAARVTFVEGHGRTAGVIRSNIAKLGLSREQARVVQSRVESWLARSAPATGGMDGAGLVLLDPPYEYTSYGDCLAALATTGHLAPAGIIVLETGRDPGGESGGKSGGKFDSGVLEILAHPPGLEPLRTKRYGDTLIHYYRKLAE